MIKKVLAAAMLARGFFKTPSYARACDHYTFRQNDVDCQSWIKADAYPLPRKITRRDDDARPQSVSIIDWTPWPTLKKLGIHLQASSRRQKNGLHQDIVVDPPYLRFGLTRH